MKELVIRMVFAVLSDMLMHLERGEEAISKDRLINLINELLNFLESNDH